MFPAEIRIDEINELEAAIAEINAAVEAIKKASSIKPIHWFRDGD